MTPVEITDKMKATARRAEARILKHIPDDGKNPTGLSEPDRYYIGIVGELAVIKLLKDNGIKAVYAPKWDGKADKGDVDVYCDGYRLVVDVKTCGKDFHQDMTVIEYQYNKYSYDGYIGVRLVGDVAEVYGYCAKKDLRRDTDPKYKKVNYLVKLDELRPMERLFGKLDKGETVIKIPA
jgi:hypothetical protein